METTQFRCLTKTFLSHYLSPKLLQFLNGVADDIDIYYPKPRPNKPGTIFEIGFEEKNDFKIIKILIISLPIENMTRCFLAKLFINLNHNFSGWKNQTSDIQRIFSMLLKSKRSQEEIFFCLGFELKQKKVVILKIYFPVLKIPFIPSFIQFHKQLIKYKKYVFLLKNFPRKIFAIDYYKNIKSQNLKIYIEFSIAYHKEINLFFNFISDVSFENIGKKILEKYILSLLKDDNISKFGLRFRGNGILKNEAKFYFGMKKNIIKEGLNKYLITRLSVKKTWLSEIQKCVDCIDGYYSYIGYGNDGVEVYLR